LIKIKSYSSRNGKHEAWQQSKWQAIKGFSMLVVMHQDSEKIRP